MSTIDFLPIEGKLIRIYFIYLNSMLSLPFWEMRDPGCCIRLGGIYGPGNAAGIGDMGCYGVSWNMGASGECL